MKSIGSIVALGGIFLLLFVVIAIAMYIWMGITYSKILKCMDYKNPWMAWIPLLNTYAFMDVTADESGKTKLLEMNIEVPNALYKFYWVIPIVLSFVLRANSLVTLLIIICNMAFLGTAFTKIYAAHDNTTLKDKTILGAISGWIAIIPLIIFTGYKKEEEFLSSISHKEPVPNMEWALIVYYYIIISIFFSNYPFFYFFLT